jgi:hypothetical protein
LGADSAVEPEYGEATAAVNAAEKALADDPKTAERGFLQARDALLHEYVASKGNRPHLALYALHRSRPNYFEYFGPRAHALLWRTVLGRTEALRKLGREEEAIAEVPDWVIDTEGRVPAVTRCPSELGGACAKHVAWLQARFPPLATSDDGGLYVKNDVWIGFDDEAYLRELPRHVKDLPDRKIVIRLTLAGRTVEKDGRLTLVRDGAPIAYTSGTVTGPGRLVVKSDDTVVIQRRLTDVERGVIPSNSISIHLRPELKWQDVDPRAEDITVYANLKRARTTREGTRIRYHLDEPLILDYPDLVWMGTDLKWLLDLARAERR